MTQRRDAAGESVLTRAPGRPRLIGVVYEPTAVEGILAAMRLPVTEPPRARARAPPSCGPYDDTDDLRPAWHDQAA